MIDTEIANAIGTIPGGGAPAAWWYSDDADNIAGYKRHEIARNEWFARFQTFAETHQGKSDEAPTWSSWDGSITLKGLVTKDGHAIPEGWRFDHKTSLMVPSRKTKADRESNVSKEFAALRRVPAPRDYMTGMPASLWGDHTISPVEISMLTGGTVVIAFCGSDPDRVNPGRRRYFPVDESKWHRLPLSTFHRLRDGQRSSAAPAGAR
ncbi:hypothetical protein GOEFS_051_00170 [Gordonia effusa NBRC 100432]|uniref:Uncharacterized protein n=1 Tax=Gordonia effusa NBRC 100432 TaxID=1077974 RepID=H0QZS1_9ACTN|nr:hypothetical protein [Gordonia effusa]GAB18322.1 hypothetical protein GOEFS_051_00170 [Gordonia effusa NBRC 100432]